MGLTNLKIFNDENAYVDFCLSKDFVKPNVSYITSTNAIKFTEDRREAFTKQYLTFEILSDGNIVWRTDDETITVRTIEYSKDNGKTWVEITSTDEGVEIPVVTGDKVLFRGENTEYCYDDVACKFDYSTAQFNLSGNIMSLLYGDDFATATTLESEYTFQYMFYGSTGLTSAENLILPATTLSDYCYGGMFQHCTSLTTAPELPATTLANSCYYQMFLGCKSLETAPELPATTLASYCYSFMFQGCTSLTTTPELPATTLAQGCYYYMFRGCSSLNYIKCLATNISATNCTNNWVNGVAVNGTFVKDANMTGWTSGYHGIPSGWTVQDA